MQDPTLEDPPLTQHRIVLAARCLRRNRALPANDIFNKSCVVYNHDALSTIAQPATDLINDPRLVIRLREEDTVLRQRRLTGLDLPGCDDHMNARPSVLDACRQFQTIDAARHVHVREHDFDPIVIFQKSYRRGRVGCGDDGKSGALDHVDGCKAEYGFILHDQNSRAT